MLSDLELLIRLQQLDDSAAKVRSKIDSYPNRLETLDALVAERKRQLEAGQERLTHERADRQAFENELAQIQTRLSRCKDQLMEVKTNKEYQAMQTEIAVAEEKVHRLEDVILERMLDGDKLVADVGRLERELIDEQRVVSQPKCPPRRWRCSRRSLANVRESPLLRSETDIAHRARSGFARNSLMTYDPTNISFNAKAASASFISAW